MGATAILRKAYLDRRDQFRGRVPEAGGGRGPPSGSRDFRDVTPHRKPLKPYELKPPAPKRGRIPLLPELEPFTETEHELFDPWGRDPGQPPPLDVVEPFMKSDDGMGPRPEGYTHSGSCGGHGHGTNQAWVHSPGYCFTGQTLTIWTGGAPPFIARAERHPWFWTQWDAMENWKRDVGTTAPVVLVPGTIILPFPEADTDADAEAERRLHQNDLHNSPQKLARLRTRVATGSRSPEFQIEFSTSGVTVGTHVQAPPGAGRKERKMQFGVGSFKIILAFGLVTEFLDFLDSFYQAVHPELRQLDFEVNGFHSPTTEERFRLVYDNFENLDMNKVIENLIRNELTDRFIGKVSKATGKAFGGASGAPIGPGRGIASGSKL